MKNYNPYIIVIITLLYFNLISCDENIKCDGTIIFDHYVTKNDRKEKKLDILCGDEINLICHLDEISLKNGCISSNLTFDFGIGDKPPKNTNIQLVNDKALQLKINTNKSVSFTVTCKYNGEGLNSTVLSILVGREPQPIEMQCLVYPNEAELQCEFEMSGNQVLEHYDILYSNHSTKRAIYNRVEFQMKNKKRKWSQKLSKFNPFGKFSVLVCGTNKFGELLQNFTFETKQIVVIPKLKQKYPEIRYITSRSVAVGITLSASIQMYEFNFNITACMVQCYYEESWFPVNIIEISRNVNKTDFNINLTVRLPHPNQSYNLQIKVQLKDAQFLTKQQIILKTTQIKSLTSPPEYPPSTFTNGFEIREGNEVIVYWKEILDIHKNGPELEYQLSEMYENGQLLSTVNWTILSNSSARLRNLDQNKSYTIRLAARNSAGLSINRSDAIEIPKATNWVSAPVHMRKTIYDDLYELSWESSPSHNIVSYTIYWCKPLDKLESMCGSLLGYKILSKHQTTFQYYNTPKSGFKNFAIAANTKNSSSGLIWFLCPIKNIPEVTYSTHSDIILNWTIPCHTNRKKHLLISYCESDPYTNTMCETDKVKTIATINQESIILSKLRRCKSYLIKIYHFYENSSQPMVINARTTEGTPPQPIAVKAVNITNTTIQISWSLPYECLAEGSISYQIIYNQSDPINFYSNGLKSYTIENLNSFSWYDIKLAVCYGMAQCSRFSKPIKIKTKYGTPAGIKQLTNNGNDNGFTYYSWQPSVQNSEFQYYEVRHNFIQDDSEIQLTSIVSNPNCTLVQSPCSRGITNYKYYVRVINIDYLTNNDLHMNPALNPAVCFEEIPYNITTLCINISCLIGEWGTFRHFDCFPESLVMKFGVILIVILGIGAGLTAGTLTGIRKYRSIKNVGHVSMPDGLDHIFKSISKANLNHKLVEPPDDEYIVPKEEYCTYEYVFSSANRLDQISVTDSMSILENQDDYLEYSCDVVPLPNPGNYVKLNDLQNQQKTATSGYTAISALQSHQPNKDEIQLSSLQHKSPTQNGYIPVSAISTISSTTAPIKMNSYIPIQMLHAINQNAPIQSNGYTPVSTLQYNTMKLPTISTNGYISNATFESQTNC